MDSKDEFVCEYILERYHKEFTREKPITLEEDYTFNKFLNRYCDREIIERTDNIKKHTEKINIMLLVEAINEEKREIRQADFLFLEKQEKIRKDREKQEKQEMYEKALNR